MKTGIFFMLLFLAAPFWKPMKIHSADVVLSFTELVLLKGGMFTMGSPASEAGRSETEGPRHHVLLDSFYMGKYEVTQREYEEVMGENPGRVKGPDLPVEYVSWYDALLFCNRLSEWEGLVPAYTIDRIRPDPGNENEKDSVRWLVTWNPEAGGYRLPTEAEWEYACRAGSAAPFATGKTISGYEANFNGEKPYGGPKGENRGRLLEAGTFAPNLFGLCDMYGNAREWCWDWFGIFSGAAETNPRGASRGSFRVIRGGSYRDGAQSLRSASRSFEAPFTRESGLGFRVARNG